MGAPLGRAWTKGGGPGRREGRGCQWTVAPLTACSLPPSSALRAPPPCAPLPAAHHHHYHHHHHHHHHEPEPLSVRTQLSGSCQVQRSGPESSEAQACAVQPGCVSCLPEYRVPARGGAPLQVPRAFGLGSRVQGLGSMASGLGARG
eukprot:2835606-Rhodomonas_salina.1